MYRWNYGFFYIETSMNHSLIFEGIRGGFNGDIAIDDISVTEGICPQRENECDFQATDCHFSEVS